MPTRRGLLLFGVLALAPMSARADYWFPATFEEEAKRDQWDRGCADWPADLPGYSAQVQDDLQIHVSKEAGSFRIMARVHVRPERGERQEKLLAQLQEMLTVGSTYPKWVLPGINEDPEGGGYFVKVEGLDAIEVVRRERYILNGGYLFKILWFEAKGMSSILYRHERAAVPACPIFAGQKTAPRWIYRMTPRPGLLDLLMAEAWLLPASNGGANLHIRMATKPANVVYQLLPERMVRSQLGVRGRKIFENFVDYRRLGKVPTSTVK